MANKPDINHPVREKHVIETATETLLPVKEVLTEEEDISSWTIDDVLAKAGVTEDQYLDALRINCKEKSLIYKRTPAQININTNNPTVMKAWQANMDLQCVSNPYACIHYIISYVTKDEHQMGQALKEVCKNLTNTSFRQQMKEVICVPQCQRGQHPGSSIQSTRSTTVQKYL